MSYKENIGWENIIMRCSRDYASLPTREGRVGQCIGMMRHFRGTGEHRIRGEVHLEDKEVFRMITGITGEMIA